MTLAISRRRLQESHSPFLQVYVIGICLCRHDNVQRPRVSCAILESFFLPSSNDTFPKCTFLSWRYLMLSIQNVAQLRTTCHEWCVQDFHNVAFHWPMSLFTFVLVMSDTSTTWLMLPTVGKHCLPKDKNSRLMVNYVGRSSYRSAYAHMPQVMLPWLWWCCMPLSDVSF